MPDCTYVPPKVWTHDAPSGGKFASINAPTAGAREDKAFPVGKHPLQLYSLATPREGVKSKQEDLEVIPPIREGAPHPGEVELTAFLQRSSASTELHRRPTTGK